MARRTNEETLRRLEGLAAKGGFDKVRAALGRRNPVVAEFGFSAETIREALDTPLPALEASGAMPLPVLEAIVRVSGRPPLVVRNGIVEGKTTLGNEFPAGTDAKIAAVEKFLPSVGRIEFVNHDMAWGGTGWVVGEDGPGHLLVATNRHVAAIVARRTFRGDGVFMFNPYNNQRYGAAIDFGEEAEMEPDPAKLFALDRFSYLADDISADIAIGRIPRPAGAAGIGILDLAEADGGDGEIVGVVGYPASDPYRNDPDDMERYFRGLYDVKRFSPGYLKLAPGDGAAVLGHDCTTLGGNSGSPVISLETGRVVGLHFAGKYGVGNSAVRISTLKTVLAGLGGAVPGAALPAAGGGEEARDRTHAPDFFAGRGGYDPDFLGDARVPLPTVPAALDLARPADATATRPHELRYEHFGVLFSARNKGPVVAAHNLDASRYRPLKRANSTWFHDLRIPREIQLDREDYADAAIDRGHMVRRAETNWGDSDAEARRADLDSFHYTNASPQHAGLNRNDEMWLGLEDYILTSAVTHGFCANVFSGPVYADDDPQFGTSGAPLPLSFWKVVSMLAADDAGGRRLHATAYVLSQGQLIQRLLSGQRVVEAAEGFVFGAYRTFQVRVRDLETMTGYGFGPLAAADPLDRVEEREARGLGAKPVVLVDRFSAVVL